MSNLLLALVCLFLGKMLQNLKQFPESSGQILNAYVIYVALPALILLQIPKLSFSWQILTPVLVAWVVMGISAVLGWCIARYFPWSRAITGALLLVITLGNTSFIGFPLIEAHLGREALPYAILYDQLGTFLAFNTLGIAIATRYSPVERGYREPLWRTLFKFPPFLALLSGFLLSFATVPDVISGVLQRIGDTLVPVVMVAVGLQWRLRVEATQHGIIVFALVFVLLIKPMIALGLVQLGNPDSLLAKTTVLEAAMPAMISTSALAATYQLAPRLVAAVIGYSLLLSFGTVWLWSFIV